MLEVININNNKWDNIVKSFEEYDIYYLQEYVKGFMIHGDGEPLLFYYQNNSIRAINVVMKRDISLDEHFKNLDSNKYFDLATPYGYGGWLIEGNGDLNSLIKEYKEWCKQNSIISEVIRFHPVLANQENLRNYYDVMDLSKTIAIELDSKDLIWKNFDSKNRNVIRKAIKNGVEIKKGLSKELLNTFKDIYNQTMARDTASDYYYFKDEFYNSILEDLKDYAEVYYAVYDNKIIASSIILKANSMLSYHLSGSLREYSSLASSNLLLCTVAEWGSENGYKTLHLGGGVGSKEDSLYAFKKAFNKNSNYQYSIGKMIFDQEKYEYLISLRENEEKRQNFFPLYRA